MADDAVKNLITVLRDSNKGFLDVGEHLESSTHRSFFMEEAQVRARYADELERAVGEPGGSVTQAGSSAAAAIHRTWGDLKAKLGGGDHTLLETAEQGEDAAKKAYQQALEDSSISSTARALIAQQFEHVRQSHDKVKAFRDATAVA